MAFEINEIGGYGSGELGDVTIADGAIQNLNSYARVLAIDSDTITIDSDTMILGAYEKFHAGNEILIHVSATNGTGADNLGRYLVAKITLVGKNGVLALDKPMFDVDLDYDYVQAVTFAEFDCLTLLDGAIVTPPPYNPFNFIGGIVAIKCWDKLIFEGGHIDLTDCGIPANRKTALRPLHWQETATNGVSDNALWAGHENYLTADKFMLNAGDGACFIAAKKMICNANSRIGNPKTHGAQFCRGAYNSVGVKPSNITNIGGSTIFIAAETIDNFTPKMIAKYRSDTLMEGKGLSRCYIASTTRLRNDEGLYAYDVISDGRRLQSVLGVNDFGNGAFGEMTNPAVPLNNYAHVTEITNGGYRLVYDRKTLSGLAPIQAGAFVIVQVIQKSANHITQAGKMAVARVLDDAANAVTLNFPAPIVNLDNYIVQIVSMPEFSNLTISDNFKAASKFDGQIGGVLAIACNDTLNITNGKLNVEGKGGAIPYGRAGLAVIGNAQNADKLPLGEGHGSVFILANKIIMNENSRIGALYSGIGTGGRFGGNNFNGENAGGGYAGGVNEDGTGAGGGYLGGGAGSFNGSRGLGGSGAAGGTTGSLGEFVANEVTGGYGSNGNPRSNFAGGSQGSHLMIIADTIVGFTQAAISTGGSGGIGEHNGINGAAGYGGGGAMNGSSGGSAGACFIYCNTAD